jgi:DNA-binding transcriptional LysR family regulator
MGGLDSHPLLEEPLLLVLPGDHPAREPIALAALSDAPWIAGLAGTQFAGALERACHSAGFSPRIVHRADDALLLRALVRSGLGIGLLPRLACAGVDDVRLAEVAPSPPRRRVAALVRRGAARRPAIAATLEGLARRASRGEGRF